MFISLAGNERDADMNKAYKTTRIEGADFNTSFLTLKEIIRALETCGSMTHILFRGSKLNQVPKENFVGENLRIVMVVWVVHECQIAITLLIPCVMLIELKKAI